MSCWVVSVGLGFGDVEVPTVDRAVVTVVCRDWAALQRLHLVVVAAHRRLRALQRRQRLLDGGEIGGAERRGVGRVGAAEVGGDWVKTLNMLDEPEPKAVVPGTFTCTVVPAATVRVDRSVVADVVAVGVVGDAATGRPTEDRPAEIGRVGVGEQGRLDGVDLVGDGGPAGRVGRAGRALLDQLLHLLQLVAIDPRRALRRPEPRQPVVGVGLVLPQPRDAPRCRTSPAPCPPGCRTAW